VKSILTVIRESSADVGSLIRSGSLDGRTAVYLSPQTYVSARQDPALYDGFDAIRFDGILMTSCLSRILGLSIKRQSFDLTSLAPLAFRRATERGERVCLVGGADGVSEKASRSLARIFPGLKIVGTWPGYFVNEAERQDVIREIVSADPHLTVIGMGGVLQDRFAADLRAAGLSGSVHTCGGFLEQTARSGGTYYPSWVDRLNLRWAFRMLDDPRIILRVLTQYPRFLLLFCLDALRETLEAR